MAERTRIGDLLVAAGLVTEEQIRRALAAQKESRRRLGEELVALGFVNEVQVTQMLSNQLSVPWVSLYHVEFTRDLLSLLPAHAAERFGVIPVYMRKVRAEGDTLYVAMDDPTNEEALAYVRDATGLPVRAMVAPPSEIRDAIGVYYFGLAPLSSRVSRVDDEVPTEKRPALIDLHNEAKRSGVAVAPPLSPEPAAPAPVSPPPAERTEAGSDGASPALPPTKAEGPSRAAESPTKKARDAGHGKPAGGRRSGGPKMLTLTLLDGTTVRLPQPPEKQPEAAVERTYEHGLTAKDLVQALTARAQGQDTSAVLPDAQWEPLFAALLSLLVRKGVVADWEFVDEWKKLTR